MGLQGDGQFQSWPGAYVTENEIYKPVRQNSMPFKHSRSITAKKLAITYDKVFRAVCNGKFFGF